MSLIKGVTDESVRLTLNTVEKRIALAKQEVEANVGMKRGLVTAYDATSRSGTTTIDGKPYPFKAVNTTVAVGNSAVFQRLVNSDRGFILLGVIL